MAITNEPGGQMQGSDNEQFNYGRDYSNLADPNASIGSMLEQVLPSDFNMGSVSVDSVPQQDIDSLFGLDASHLFNDSLDSRVFPGMDSMVGVAGLDNIHPEALENEQVFAEQTPLPFDFPPPDTANPLEE